MSQKLICQLCGGENDPSAQRCTHCGAIFEALPDNLRPTHDIKSRTNAFSNSEPERKNSTGDSDATDWLKKYYDDIQFDDTNGSEEPTQPDDRLNDPDAPAPDLLGELFPDIRDSIAAASGVTPPVSATPEPQPTQNAETTPEPRPIQTAKSLEDSDERDFEDFSIYRPERKWDDFSLADGQDDPADTAAPGWTIAKTEAESNAQPDESEEDYVDFSKVRPETKLGDDGLGKETPPQRTESEPKFELNEISDLDNASEKPSGETVPNETEKKIVPESSERNGDNGEIESEEEEYVDFSIHRPQNKLEPGQTDSVVKDVPSAEAAGNEIPIEPSEGFETSPLVDEFLASLTGEPTSSSSSMENPGAAPDEVVHDIETGESNQPTAYDEIAAFWNSDTKPESDDEKTGSYLSEMQPVEQPTAGDGRNEAESDAEAKPDAPSIPRTRAIYAADDEEENDAPIPFVSKADGTDEIPWNLFENSEMVFPSLPSYSRASYKSAASNQSGDSTDYQERMVAGILKKVFHAERLSRGMKNTQSRKKHRGGLLVFSLIAILGVLFILGGNVGAGLPLVPSQGNASVQSAAFTAALAEITASDRVEIILDYTFASEAELNETTRFVVDEFRRIGTRLTVIAANDAAVTLAEELFPVTGDFGRVPIAAVMDPLGAFTLPPNESGSDPDAIVLFAADAARAQRWIETARLFRPESDLFVVSAARVGPVLRPFVASRRIRAGLLTADERNLVSGAEISQPKQIAVWYLIGLAIAAMLIGTIARHPFTPVIATEESENGGESGDGDDADGNEGKNNGKGAGKR